MARSKDQQVRGGAAEAAPAAAPTLTERRDGFAYGYWMNCECGEASYLSPEDYFEGENAARMRCEHCGASIHFGPAVAALRDRDDPALRDDIVPTLAWYHTSTTADWPSPSYAAQFAKALSWVERDFGISRDRYIAKETSKALHVGTYETAIENMLRRMDDQADGGSQFYLYRVALALDAGRINAGYRDENHAVASDISIRELEEEGLDAVRYLNVHEAMGVLSLAVRPQVIAAVQMIPIPIQGLSVAIDPAIFRTDVEALARVTGELEAADEAAAAIIDSRDRRMMELGARPDPTGLAKRAGKLRHQYYDRWRQLEDHLGERCLPNASGAIRHDFNEAMASWRSAQPQTDGHDFVERYQCLAALIERSESVIDAVGAQEWRVAQPR
ncbi:hypothetical protein ACPW96_21545 [Micromonospora sp. DT81.3]|uniref:hypothetical protein n=1 Tax=Micromonospora sp. DT81.3 TaxID=3416523 RepID=UPI003CF00644